ncbi:MAG: DNA repair exonuclease [Thermoanaerobaculaceae bacterium]|nr:DNA repair exonuclease [Thermoanaerobaculaceae bacterium]
MSFCFVHAADLHLDTPFEGVSEMSGVVAEKLRDASLEAFDGVVRLAIDRRAAFVLLAGDLYDGAERGVRAQLRFLRGLGVLSSAGIPVFVVHGNHDPVGGWPGVREWPPGVTVFGSDQVGAFPVTRDGVVLARVYGISYGHREVAENLALRFRREEGPGLHIGLLHCNVGDDPAHGRYSPCSLDDLDRAGMDYWALGHVHKRQVLREGRPWVVYPGNTQGRSPKPSERGAKGACVVHVEGGEVRSVEHVDLDRVRFVALDVDVAGVADLGALRVRLVAEVEALTAAAGGRYLLVRCTLRGRGAVHTDLRCHGGVDELLRDLRDETYEGSVWWEGLRDVTRSEIDLEAVRGRGDFAAELLLRAEGLVAAEAELKSFVETALRGGAPSGVHRHLASTDVAEAKAVIEEALVLALDLLGEESEACT